jgi:hypothetical protein
MNAAHTHHHGAHAHDSSFKAANAASDTVSKANDTPNHRQESKRSGTYNEQEDRLFVFPPENFRKSDRVIRVLMSR